MHATAVLTGIILFIFYTVFVFKEMKKYRFNAWNNGVFWRVELIDNEVVFYENGKEVLKLPVTQIAEICKKTHKEADEVIEKDKNMVGRAVVGGLLFGTAGAVVGAMTALQKKQVIKKGKTYEFIYIGLRDGRDLYLSPTIGYEYHFNKFLNKFREVQRLG